MGIEKKTIQISFRYLASAILIVVMSCFFWVAHGAESYVKWAGEASATLTSVYSSGNKVYFTFEFKNSSSSPCDFSDKFKLDVWQNGRECERESSTNYYERIKDGATISVKAVFSLLDSTSFVELDVGVWFAWNDKPVIIYFNPSNQNWGSKKADISGTATPKPTATPKAVQTPAITLSPEVALKTNTSKSTWVCPKCGKEITSNFCPDCGTASPTPTPTPTPKPTPTVVPMDTNKPAENVVQYVYAVYTDKKAYKGYYTGEIIDGFPHGYGFFECDEWVYWGNWAYGSPEKKDFVYSKKDLTANNTILAAYISNKDSFKTIGNTVLFGHYEQDNNTDNGQEAIEWIVLDVQGNKALLISRYGLDCKPYNLTFKPITWETCTLRTWLNEEFVGKAFSTAEQKAILTTAVDNSKSQGYKKWSADGGKNTQDKIFLLSYAEANEYLDVTSGGVNNMKSIVVPTEYAMQAGAYTSDTDKTSGGTTAGWWWLRSPGVSANNAAYVYSDGSLYGSYVNNDSGSVRPALWIDLESDIF